MQNIFSISSESDFSRACLETFRRQAAECEPYARYLSLLGVNVGAVNEVSKIPFLPIEFFKTEKIVCGNAAPQVTFTSSGTTGAETSRHYVTDVQLYEESFTRGFEHFYGSAKNYCILALLPNYLERQGSSLVYMVENLARQSGHPQSGFYLHNRAELVKTLCALHEANQPTILIGVTFALLDLAEEWGRGELPQWGSLTVMETGGMKGRRQELPREELHRRLCAAFGVEAIHSEYGMTELLSQAYSAGEGNFFTPPWARIVLRDLHNPFAQAGAGVSGGVNVIDLANQNSCAFIETQDLGKAAPDGSVEILGRMDKSQARGCSMLV
jgi:phenylacetate-coenzyme A ligase PaaK-like adenylate-forming protein